MKSPIKILLLTFVFFITCIGCYHQYHLKKYADAKDMSPPNSIKVADNFFCDQTEISNLSWREFIYWTERFYGKNSPEYLATIPDTTVWMNLDSLLTILHRNYHRHPAWNDYPVVGISQAQASAFSKWRSDRVLEMLLIKNKKIARNTSDSNTQYFTIERYFNQTYAHTLVFDSTTYYPEFRLPSLAERQVLLHYADSVEAQFASKSPSNYRKNRYRELHKINSDVVLTSEYDTPTLPYLLSNFPKKYAVTAIYHLRGNVNEWTNKPNISAGGGWHHKRERILAVDTFHTATPNAWTGFRNVCEWKKWTY